MSDRVITLLQIAAIPVISYIVSIYLKRQDVENSQAVARINSTAEMQESYATWSKTAADVTKDMLAPMAAQLKTVTSENLTLQDPVKQLRTDNKKLAIEQQRLKQVEASQREKINKQSKEIDQLKARLASLEKLDLQRQGEIQAMKSENDRLQEKVNRISQALDTGKFGGA